MPRTQRKLAKGEAAGEIADTLLLKYADRCRQQGFVFGGKGTCIEFDFPSAPQLRTDDLLMLDDGGLAEVVADVEPLLEVREKDFAKAARLVWRLGNRHMPVQVFGSRIRVQHLPEIEALLAELGITGVPMTAPFEPDDAEGHGHHGHEHHHHDRHDHDRHDHDRHDHHDGHAAHRHNDDVK
jgi:urease accessory protein